jgi:hypothetical protein
MREVTGLRLALSSACLVAACGSNTSDESDARVVTVSPDASVRVDAAPIPDGRAIDAAADVSVPDASVPDAPAPDAIQMADAREPDAGSNPAYGGTVLAATLDGAFVIATATDTRIFRAQGYCFGVIAGDAVSFSQSPIACLSNSFLDVRTGKSCDVVCPLGAADAATILASDNETFALAVGTESRIYESTIGCFGFIKGDEVVFESSAFTCFSNTMIDLQSGATCNVNCPLGVADPAKVLADANSVLALDSPLWGQRIFDEGISCFSLFGVGDDVLLSGSGASCFTTTVIDLDSSRACDVQCPLSEAYPGTVTATNVSGMFVIQTAFGKKTFTEKFFCIVFVGDHVLLKDSPAFCLSNTLVDLDRNTSCEVTCQ